MGWIQMQHQCAPRPAPPPPPPPVVITTQHNPQSGALWLLFSIRAQISKQSMYINKRQLGCQAEDMHDVYKSGNPIRCRRGRSKEKRDAGRPQICSTSAGWRSSSRSHTQALRKLEIALAASGASFLPDDCTSLSRACASTLRHGAPYCSRSRARGRARVSHVHRHVSEPQLLWQSCCATHLPKKCARLFSEQGMHAPAFAPTHPGTARLVRALPCTVMQHGTSLRLKPQLSNRWAAPTPVLGPAMESAHLLHLCGAGRSARRAVPISGRQFARASTSFCARGRRSD